MANVFSRILYVGAICFGVTVPAIGSAAYAGDLIVTVHDANGAPVADAVVKVTRKDGPAIKTAPLKAVTRVNQLETKYTPFVSVITVGSKVEFTNSDDWAHHVYSFSKSKRFDVTVPAHTESKPVAFDKVGVIVIGCNIHDRMLSYIYVHDGGRAVKTDKSGVVKISGLSAGDFTVSAWHPLLFSRRKIPESTISVEDVGVAKTMLIVTLKQPKKKKKYKPYKY